MGKNNGANTPEQEKKPEDLSFPASQIYANYLANLAGKNVSLLPKLTDLIIKTPTFPSSSMQPGVKGTTRNLPLAALLKRKNLPPDLFAAKTHFPISWENSMGSHAAWAFTFIYSVPYPSHSDISAQGGIARFFHGIQHVSRAAHYALALTNLYRKYKDHEALALTERGLKLIQIALLFHDSARENEGVDHWDQDSSTFLYHYLTKMLGVDKENAILLAEATANKDAEQEYFYIHEQNDEILWKAGSPKESKSIYQKIIHDADCLDIIRVHGLAFNATYLDFYKNVAENNADAQYDLVHLINDIRGMIDEQGDGMVKNAAVKRNYEENKGYATIEHQITSLHSCTLNTFYANGSLLSENIAAATVFINNAPWQDGSLILARGIGSPSRLGKKADFFGKRETFVDTEIRKALRRPGVPTRTQKSNNCSKDGNPHRSTARLGYGGHVFTSAGFLLLNPALSRIENISETTKVSGWGKKKYYRQVMDEAEKKQKLTDMLRNLKFGTTPLKFGVATRKSHVFSEIEYHIEDFDAIYFSTEPNAHNKISYGTTSVKHANSPLLQAIFIQNAYARQTGKVLPIYHYSAGYNRLAKIVDVTQDDIFNMWIQMCQNYILENLETASSLSIEEIKILSMYGERKVAPTAEALTEAYVPADIYYDVSLQERITKAIEDLLRSYNKVSYFNFGN